MGTCITYAKRGKGGAGNVRKENRFLEVMKQKLQGTKKRVIIIGGAIILVITATTVTVIHRGNTARQESGSIATRTVVAQQGNLSLGVSGSGTTYVGTTNQYIDLSFGTSNLVLTVEELLNSSGATVKKGDPLFRVSKKEIAALIQYYEEQKEEAQNTYQTAKLTYESNLAQAKYEYETNKALGTTATLNYEASLDQLKDQVSEAKEALNNADSKISDYTSALKNDTYASKYKISTLKKELTSKEEAAKQVTSVWNKQNKTYEKEKKSLEAKVKQYEEEVSKARKQEQSAETDYKKKLDAVVGVVNEKEASSSYTVEGKALSELKKAYEQQQEAQKRVEEAVQKLQDAKQSLEKQTKEYEQTKQKKEQAEQQVSQAKQQYEQAYSSYEKEKQEAESSLKELKSNYSTLKASYEAAVRNQQTQAITIEKEYQSSKLTYENAKTIYEATISGLDQEMTAAKESVASIDTNLKTLKAIEKDGIIKAEQDGTISSLGYEVGETLVEGQAVASYTVPETIQMDITVSQEKIASLQVGNTATVSVDGVRGSLEGTIKEIATSPTSSGSVSKVTYTVTISLDNKEGTLSAGNEATVSIINETLENVVYVPIHAVTVSGDKSTVTRRKEDGTTEKVTVKTGKENGIYVVITEGISAGDTCVMEQK